MNLSDLLIYGDIFGGGSGSGGDSGGDEIYSFYPKRSYESVNGILFKISDRVFTADKLDYGFFMVGGLTGAGGIPLRKGATLFDVIGTGAVCIGPETQDTFFVVSGTDEQLSPIGLTAGTWFMTYNLDTNEKQFDIAWLIPMPPDAK